MAASLETLPPEILDIIAAFCTSKDGRTTLCNIRSTCRKIEDSIRKKWESEHFTTRCIDLSPASLTKLRDLGLVTGLAKEVRSLTINCEDDSRLCSSRSSGPNSPIEAARIGLLLGVALENFANLDHICFQPRTDDQLSRDGTGQPAAPMEYSNQLLLMILRQYL